jgi:hypothetical protein
LLSQGVTETVKLNEAVACASEAERAASLQPRAIAATASEETSNVARM